MNILSVVAYLFMFLGIFTLGSLFTVFIFWWAVVVDGDTVENHNGKMRFFKSNGTLRNPDKRQIL